MKIMKKTVPFLAFGAALFVAVGVSAGHKPQKTQWTASGPTRGLDKRMYHGYSVAQSIHPDAVFECQDETGYWWHLELDTATRQYDVTPGQHGSGN